MLTSKGLKSTPSALTAGSRCAVFSFSGLLSLKSGPSLAPETPRGRVAPAPANAVDGRATRRSTYLRRAVLKVLAMSPAERAAFDPSNGFYELAKAIIDAPKRGKDGAVVVAVWREVKETLGERIGSRWKETQENAQGQPAVINDMPRPESKDVN